VRQRVAYTLILGELVFGLFISQIIRAAITSEDNELVLEDYLQLSDWLRFVILYYYSKLSLNKQENVLRRIALEIEKKRLRPSAVVTRQGKQIVVLLSRGSDYAALLGNRGSFERRDEIQLCC